MRTEGAEMAAELMQGGIDAVAAEAQLAIGSLIADGVAQIAAQAQDFVLAENLHLALPVLGRERFPRCAVRCFLAVETPGGGNHQCLTDGGKEGLIEKSRHLELGKGGDHLLVGNGECWHGVFQDVVWLADASP